ncbi:MAG TPA: SH3 domain-containing protein [Vicinamibacterales bacterium]
MARKLLVLLPVLLFVAAVTTFAATVRVRVGNTPLRASPSQSAAVVDQLKAGAVLDLVDVNRDWYKVRDPLTKKEGFVLASAVDLEPGSAPAVSLTQKPGAGPAAAKPARPPARPPKKGDWTDRGYLWMDGIYQSGSSAFTQTQTWSYFAETATATIEFPAKNAPGFEVSGGYRVWRNLAVGAGVTVVNRSTATSVTGSIPNPIYVNRPRALSGGFSSNNTETAIHLQATWAIPMSPKMMLMVFAGPSIFNVKQTIVDPQGVTVSTDAYPFDSATITLANTTDLSKTAIGFGAGADFSYYFTRFVGVGAMVRFARASVSFPVTNPTRALSVDAGGFQAGGGLRILFPSSKWARPATPAKPQPKPQPKPATPPKKK